MLWTRAYAMLCYVLVALLRRVNIRIIIYLDDMLLMGRTLPKIVRVIDTLILLLQHFKTWNFAMGGKFSNENPIWSFRQMPQQKAGAILQFPQGCEMVKGGEAFSHKCSRITGIKICNTNFHKEFVTLDHSCSGGEQSRSGISLHDEGYLQSTAFKINKSIWNYLLSHQITITVEYLPSRMNVRADCESGNTTDSFDWKLHQNVFLKITKLLGIPSVALFASRMCHQLPNIWHGSQIQTVLQRMQCSGTGTKCLLLYSHLSSW